MDVGQARDYLARLTDMPAMKAIKEHEETLEEIVCLLDDVDTFLKHMDRMPDFEIDDRTDREWLAKTQQWLDTLRSYSDTHFLQNVTRGL